MERRFLFTDNKVCSRENICFNLTEQKFGSNKIFENEIKSEVSSLNFELLGLWLKGIKGNNRISLSFQSTVMMLSSDPKS